MNAQAIFKRISVGHFIFELETLAGLKFISTGRKERGTRGKESCDMNQIREPRSASFPSSSFLSAFFPSFSLGLLPLFINTEEEQRAGERF